MKTIALTVLTEPLPAPPTGIISRLKWMFRPLTNFLRRKPVPRKTKYGGHYAVTRSLVEGLQKTGADFNYNPKENKFAQNVIVLSGPSVLRNAIRQKKNGDIRFLLAGPNIADSVLDEDGIVGDPAIDYFVVPSEWIEVNVVKQLDVLKQKILRWHVGVDTRYWSPQKANKKRNVLVYWKTEGEDFCRNVEDLLVRQNYDPIRITYGKYRRQEFKAALATSMFAVFISRSESQGIALAEAWSMDVPTLVWDPGELVFRGKPYEMVSACP